MKKLLISTSVLFITFAFMSQPTARACDGIGRASGVLLHPTALPNKYGVGDMGPEAFQFVEFLDRAKQTYWQVLPLGPVDRGGGPYSTYSAFAGNPLLISPELMRKDGLLEASDLENVPNFPRDRVDFPAVFDYKERLFHLAWDRFHRDAARMTALKEFEEKEAAWLGEYSLFMAALEHFKNRSWNQWEQGLKSRTPDALKHWRGELADAILYQKFLQFLFFKQWRQLKEAANRVGIGIIGDVAIYVGYNSADVWAHQEMFKLDAAGNPRFVAGAPPDEFSKDGQRWGMPVYDWKAHEQQQFAWWIARFQKALEMADVVRLDHFRGFEAYWEIPASEPTARNGKWIKAPGEPLFERLRARFPKMPFIAEDLGFITPEVRLLRDHFSLPGMLILQFELFGGKVNPDNYPKNSVVYPGTHDNNTIMGWFYKLDEGKRKELLGRYKAESPQGLHWYIIQTAQESPANLSIIALQDVLGLGETARFNDPSGLTTGNWSWRFQDGALTDEVAQRFAKLTESSHRSRSKPPPEK